MADQALVQIGTWFKYPYFIIYTLQHVYVKTPSFQTTMHINNIDIWSLVAIWKRAIKRTWSLGDNAKLSKHNQVAKINRRLTFESRSKKTRPFNPMLQISKWIQSIQSFITCRNVPVNGTSGILTEWFCRSASRLTELSGEELPNPLEEFLLDGIRNRLAALWRDFRHELVDGDVLEAALPHDFLAVLLQLIAPTALYQLYSEEKEFPTNIVTKTS